MPIQGSIEEAGLADVLQLLSGGKKTGSLSVADGSVRGEIILVDGRVAFATVSNRADRLGEILLSSGRITRRQLDDATRQQSRDPTRPLGTILVASSVIEQSELDRYAAIQAQEAVYTLFTWTRGTFVFTSNLELPPSTLSTPLDPQSLLLEGARRVDEWSLIQKKVPTFDLVYKRRGDSSGGSVAADLSGDQQRILPLLDGSRDVHSVAKGTGLGEFEIGKALYGLLMVGLIQIVERRSRMRHLDYRELLAYVVREAEYGDAQRRREAGRHIADCPACSERLRSIHVRRTTGAVNASDLPVSAGAPTTETPALPAKPRIAPPLTPERATTVETQVARKKPAGAPRVAPPMTPARAVTVETTIVRKGAPGAKQPPEPAKPAPSRKIGTRPIQRVAPPARAATPPPAAAPPLVAAEPPAAAPTPAAAQAPAVPVAKTAPTPTAVPDTAPAVVPVAAVAQTVEAPAPAKPAPTPAVEKRGRPERRARDRRAGLDRRRAERRDDSDRRHDERRTGMERRHAADSAWLRENRERRRGQRRAALRRGSRAPDRRGQRAERRAPSAAPAGPELLMRREVRPATPESEGAADLPWIMTPRESIELIRASRPLVRPSEAAINEALGPAAASARPARPSVERMSPVSAPAPSTRTPRRTIRNLAVAAGIVGVAGLGYALGQMRGPGASSVGPVTPLQAVTTNPSPVAGSAPGGDLTPPTTAAPPVDSVRRATVEAPRVATRPPARSRMGVTVNPSAEDSTRLAAQRSSVEPRRAVQGGAVTAPAGSAQVQAAPPAAQAPPPAQTPPAVTNTAAQAQTTPPPPTVAAPPEQPPVTASPPAVTRVTHTAKEPDRELSAGGWTVVNPADAGTALGGTIGAIEGLTIESIAQATAGARVRVRVAQVAESGDRIVLTETRAGAAVRIDGPVRVTALRVMPASEAYPFATGSASLGNVLITAKSTLPADVLRALLDRLAALQ